MTAVDVDGLAAELLDAYRTGEAIEPLTDRFPALTADEAYDIQLAQVRSWTEAGASSAGHKVGLTSKAMQQQLGVD